jgi:hypothetical protein
MRSSTMPSLLRRVITAAEHCWSPVRRQPFFGLGFRT